MTVSVEEDFREFVVARWPDLEGVAFVVTLDSATARKVTADSLAALHQHWREALHEGRPGAMARRSVLSGAVAATPAQPRRPSGAGVPNTDRPVDGAHLQDAGSSPVPWADPQDDDAVLTALEDVVRAGTPLERALVGAASVWGAGPDEVADLLGMPFAEVRSRAAALRARLVAAHDAARAADGLAPAHWTFDVDLDAVVEHLLAGQGDPPDPAALVQDRQRSVRRRSVVAGGALALAAGATSWWMLDRQPSATASRTSASATPSAFPSPDDRSWASIARWAPRGRLATDPRVRSMVIRRSTDGGRLLWADDMAGQRLVVSATLNPGTEDAILQGWWGAAGADPASLQEVQIQSPYIAGSVAVVPLAVPTSPGTLLVILSRPTVVNAQYSAIVRPTAAGTIGRTWLPVTLDAGIGFARWSQEAGPALRVRCAGFDGPALGSAQMWVGDGGSDGLAGFTEETTRLVAAAVGQPADTVRTEVVTDAQVGGSVIDPTAFSARGGDGRVRVVRTTTADGSVVRSVRVVDDGRSGVSWLDLEPPAVLPAGTPRDEPVVLRLDDARPGVGRFLVVAPGAARVQLLSTSPNAYPVSKVTKVRHGVAVVDVVNAQDASAFRLVRRDATGHRFGNAVPRPSRDLLDLRPGEQTQF